MKFFHQSVFLLVVISAVILFVNPSFSQDTMFVDRASEAGIQGAVYDLQFGVAWGDFDNDGDDDLFVARDHQNQLFQNNGDGTFVDIAEAAGVDDHEMAAIGAAWGDYDGDGDLDLYVVNSASEDEEVEVENRLFRNNGDGTFTNVAEETGVDGHLDEEHDHDHSGKTVSPAQEEDHDHDHAEESGGYTSAAWADYDNDGDLDLFATSRVHGVVLYENHEGIEFHNITEEAGLVIEAHDHGEEHEEDHAEEEEGHEEEEHEEGGVGVEHASFGDFDNDGDLDLYLSVAVAHEHDHEEEAEAKVDPSQEETEEEHAETENRFFMNNGDGTFSDKTDDYELGDPNEAVTHSSVWGDYDNDGWFDLLVLNLGSFNEGTAEASRLFHNNGDGSFTDMAETAGLVDVIYPFGATWADLNNDGWLDIVMINHPSHDDFEAGEFYERPHPIFMNNGDGTFTNINKEPVDAILDTGVTDINHVIGLSVSDYDNDGDLDYAITENHGDGPFLLYTSNTIADGNHWVQIALQQDGLNPFAVGSRVEVTAGGMTQYRLLDAGSTGFASQSSQTLHFGLGQATSAEVKVVWNDGSHELFSGLAVDQQNTLIKGQGTLTSIPNWVNY